MSSRRMTSSRTSEDDINELILKLQAALPESSSRCASRVPASKILKEICNYVKRLHREADNLSERISQLLVSTDTSSVDADILRSLLLR
ncbi:transcription factor PRE6-like [Actinidia eriantha]|uniref:transcription factor PRE6-like n=1 Tax=Actinidia eriantha TaxID=165200 RepID=UPI00258F4C7C|nr:transcription factor PRE6-like [Actinidia eriantha]